ncbi:MAG: hypothetical protein LUM44_09955 [Pyrinomonadaceae bacterium]|nr:hypothetical protein [Pyrinomonadaceae bacterium]
MEVKEAFINRELAAREIEKNLVENYNRLKSDDLGGNFNISADDYALLLEGIEEGWIKEPIIKTEAGIMIGPDAVNISSEPLNATE